MVTSASPGPARYRASDAVTVSPGGPRRPRLAPSPPRAAAAAVSPRLFRRTRHARLAPPPWQCPIGRPAGLVPPWRNHRAGRSLRSRLRRPKSRSRRPLTG